MSLQIVKKFIGADAVDGSKIKLLNNQAIRVRNAAGSADISVLKLNALNDLVLDGNDIDMSAAIVKNISEAKVTALKLGASSLSISQGTAGGNPALNAGAVEVICSAAPTVNSSLTNKNYVDTQVAAAQVAAANFVQYSYTLQAGDISNGYVDLQNKIVHESLVASLGRQMLMGHNVDYTIANTGANGVSRIIFANDIASGGNLAAVAGDIMYFMYLAA